MSEYTPATEEVRDTLIEGTKLDARNSMRSDPRDWHEALEAVLDKVLPAFWEAARASVLTEQSEPEWEYRWARENGEHAWPFGAGDSEDGETLDKVKAAPARDPEPEYFDGAHIERRTPAAPAGPWVPVEENGENHA
jgi:hypothetical protein